VKDEAWCDELGELTCSGKGGVEEKMGDFRRGGGEHENTCPDISHFILIQLTYSPGTSHTQAGYNHAASSGFTYRHQHQISL
jgi:hypothetical protein